MDVVWSETAIETFLKVIDYLFEHWTDKEIQAFDDNVEALIQRIATHNQICPESKLLGYRKCVINSNNSLVYYITNKTLFLVTFLHNKSEHSF